MSKRKIEFHENEYYHVFNRGVDKRAIFLEKGDLYYFFDAMIISNKEDPIKDRDSGRRKEMKMDARNEKPLISIIAYCLLPNHFHFILKQNIDGGISKFMNKLGASYVGYFNKKYNRSGTLFQGRFKANIISGDFSIPLLSAYVNLNYKHHKINPREKLVKSSIFEYFKEEKGESICNQEEIDGILEQIGSLGEYKKYINRQSEYFTENKERIEKFEK